MYTHQNMIEQQEFLIGAVDVTARMGEAELYESDALENLADYIREYAADHPSVNHERLRRYSARALRLERDRRRDSEERRRARLACGGA